MCAQLATVGGSKTNLCSCIDQNNLDERTEQVRNVHRIFSYADEVCSWLGTASDDIEKLFDTHSRLSFGPVSDHQHIRVADAFKRQLRDDDDGPLDHFVE